MQDFVSGAVVVVEQATCTYFVDKSAAAAFIALSLALITILGVVCMMTQIGKRARSVLYLCTAFIVPLSLYVIINDVRNGPLTGYDCEVWIGDDIDIRKFTVFSGKFTMEPKMGEHYLLNINQSLVPIPEKGK